VVKEIYPLQQKTVNGVTFRIEKKIEGKTVLKKIEVEDKNQTFQFEEKVQALTLQDFEKYFSMNQLGIVKMFGDYKLNEYDSEKSDRLILITEKI